MNTTSKLNGASVKAELWNTLSGMQKRAFGDRFITNHSNLNAWNKPFAELSELKQKAVLNNISEDIIHTLNYVIS